MKNSVHLDANKHPFQFSTTAGRAAKPKMAHMTGVGAKPGGEGSMQSANAAMKKKRPMQGPGSA